MKKLALVFIVSCFFISCVLFIGCKKDKETNSDVIVGKWEWVKNITPFVGQETNPQTAGFTMTLEFSNNGTVNEYKNGLLISTSSRLGESFF